MRLETAISLIQFIFCLVAPERFTLCQQNWSGVRVVLQRNQNGQENEAINLHSKHVCRRDGHTIRKKRYDQISWRHHRWSVNEAKTNIFPFDGEAGVRYDREKSLQNGCKNVFSSKRNVHRCVNFIMFDRKNVKCECLEK